MPYRKRTILGRVRSKDATQEVSATTEIARCRAFTGNGHLGRSFTALISGTGKIVAALQP
jgi:hypothetical protein